MLKKLIFLTYMFSLAIAGNVFAEQDNHVTAYYFHTTFRCASCHKIEEYTGETINTNFADDLNSGKLQYQMLNVDEKGNEHFVNDYNLYTKSVVLSLVKDGKEVKSKNLEKVWEYLRNKDKFMGYVKSETESFLKELE